MSRISQLVTQSGADTFTSVAIETGLVVDGKSGWQINRISAYWVDASLVVASDWWLAAIVSTDSAATTFGEEDEFGRLMWGMQNTAGVAVAVPFEPIKSLDIFEPRVTVQPQIYCAVLSSITGTANDIIFEIYYEAVKLTDLEVLRLLAGGA